MSGYLIRVLLNEKCVQTVPLDKRTVTIGRLHEADVVIDNLAVSRYHAAFVVEDDGTVVLEDRGSENGILVNGEHVLRAVVVPGDEILLGKHQLVLAHAAEEQDPVSAQAPRGPSDAYAAMQTVMVGLPDCDGNEVEPASEPEERVDPGAPAPSFLVVDPGSGEERVVRLTGRDFEIGRGPTSDLVLNHPRVSRCHATVRQEGSEFRLEDHETPNGSLVNGRRIRSYRLENDDLIQIGSASLVFRQSRSGYEEDRLPPERATCVNTVYCESHRPDTALKDLPPPDKAGEAEDEPLLADVETRGPMPELRPREEDVTGRSDILERRTVPVGAAAAARPGPPAGATLVISMDLEADALPAPLRELLSALADDTIELPLRVRLESRSG